MKKMEKEDIRIREIAVHILDSLQGKAQLAEEPLEFGSNMAEFISTHLVKLLENDKAKKGFFLETSEVKGILKDYQDTNFMEMSKELAEMLYGIMNSNIDIPQAYLYVVRFAIQDREYLGILKMNFKSIRTIRIKDGEPQIVIISGKMPEGQQNLEEAAVVDLQDLKIRLIEKKYEVNGIKTEYFSQMFLKCETSRSELVKLKLVLTAVDWTFEDLDDLERMRNRIEIEGLMCEMLEETGQIVIKELVESMDTVQKKEFEERMQRYQLWDSIIRPKQEKTVKMLYEKQLKSSEGIELRIPEQSREKLSLQMQEDGTVKVILNGLNGIDLK